MGELDDFQFQPILQDFTDGTVVLLGSDNQANLQKNRVRLRNNHEWSGEQKHEEKRKGKNFMKRIKTRWDLEFPESRRTAQNLVDNGKRFKKKGWGNIGKQEEPIVE